MPGRFVVIDDPLHSVVDGGAAMLDSTFVAAAAGADALGVHFDALRELVHAHVPLHSLGLLGIACGLMCVRHVVVWRAARRLYYAHAKVE
jgi:hypothetical protein